jgi:hypothetical protein
MTKSVLESNCPVVLFNTEMLFGCEELYKSLYYGPGVMLMGFDVVSVRRVVAEREAQTGICAICLFVRTVFVCCF